MNVPATAIQDEAVDLVLAERISQDRKWGGPAHDDTETEGAWASYILEYATGTGRGAGRSFATRMQKVAALGLAALEAELRRGKRPE